MNTPARSAFADRLASLSLKMLGSINILFVLAFYLALLFAVSQAQAEAQTEAQDAPVCTGRNLLADMQRDNPDLLTRIRAEGAAVENSAGLLWRISKDGVADSYLFGTLHMSDPRVVQLTDAAQAAFDDVSTVVIETTDILDQSKMMASMLSHPELMMFTDETTLFSLLSEEDREAVEEALRKRGIPPASIAKMKPWMIVSMVAMPACELARKAAGAPVLDIKLAQDAETGGKTLQGLETVQDQLGAMASLPMEFHMRGLVDTLKLGDRVDDVIETMIVLYLEGNTGMFWPFFQAILPPEDGGDGGYAAFEETMVVARNRTMAERAAPVLERGSAFLAVGALHLPGEDGLVSLLRQQGYSVETVAADASGNTSAPVAGE